jgi:hypothetical protein
VALHRTQSFDHLQPEPLADRADVLMRDVALNVSQMPYELVAGLRQKYALQAPVRRIVPALDPPVFFQSPQWLGDREFRELESGGQVLLDDSVLRRYPAQNHPLGARNASTPHASIDGASQDACHISDQEAERELPAFGLADGGRPWGE